MSITVGTILRVVAIMTWVDGNIMENVFNAVITGAGGPFDDDDIVDDAVAWCDDMYANLTTTVANNVDGTEIRVYEYDSIDDDWDEVGSAAWTWDPSNAADYLPRGVAFLINAKTLDPDVNGKKYIGGLTEDSPTDAIWTAGTIANMALFAIDWYTGFVGGTSGASWTPSIWSVVGTVAKAMSGTVILPTIPAYQRRRKKGIGI